MSYSLEWVNLPEDASLAKAQFDACIDELKACVHVPPCIQAYFDLAGPYRFELNIASMAVCRDGMHRTDMMFQATAEPFPDWPFSSVEDWRNADQARRDAYNTAEMAASAQTVPGAVGIPSFKVSSNGPWLITPDEITGALRCYDDAPESVRAALETDRLWRTFLGWLRECAQHGGFTVT